MAVDQREALSNRQRKILVKKIAAIKAAEPKPERPAPEVYIAPEVKHEDDRLIPGLTGRGAILRADNLKKLLEKHQKDPKEGINVIQYCAGIDYVEIVEAFYASASGMAKLSEEAGKVGGAGDPIHRYLKGRPARQIDGKVVGYIPTQRPRNPSASRAQSDGWTHAKLLSMSRFSKLARLVENMPRDQRTALCILVIDPARPYLPHTSLAAATKRIFGYTDTAGYARLTRWLAAALDEIEPEVHALRMAA